MDNTLKVLGGLFVFLFVTLISVMIIREVSGNRVKVGCKWGYCIDGRTCRANPWGSNCSHPMRVNENPCRRESYHRWENREHTCRSDCDCNGKRRCSLWGYCN